VLRPFFDLRKLTRAALDAADKLDAPSCGFVTAGFPASLYVDGLSDGEFTAQNESTKRLQNTYEAFFKLDFNTLISFFFSLGSIRLTNCCV
jgi:hypothetical protein